MKTLLIILTLLFTFSLMAQDTGEADPAEESGCLTHDSDRDSDGAKTKEESAKEVATEVIDGEG